MGQVAFDTLKFVETLEEAGLPKNQARAISLAVSESHEAADVATRADIIEVKRDIADVRKDLSAEIALLRKDTEGQHALLRKDMESLHKDMASLTNMITVKLTKVMVTTVGLGIAIATLIMKFL